MSVPDSTEGSQTDWDRLADPSDEGIDYSEIPPLDDSFFADAALRMPAAQESVTIRLDRDVLAWLRSRGEELGSHINSILRAYKKAHESA